MLRYVEGSEIKLKTRDRIFVDAVFFSGEKYEALQPQRLFPISGLTRYISLMDDKGNAVCVIHSLDDLMPDSREAILSALNERYVIPKITKVLNWKVKQRHRFWTVETTHGNVEIEIVDSNNIIRLFDDRVLIKDSSDNRYEIPDLNKLDSHSLRQILPDI